MAEPHSSGDMESEILNIIDEEIAQGTSLPMMWGS
jgi:hypothetical protein